MTTQQPAALWIAYELEIGTFVPNVLQNEIVLRQNAAAELRRQHAHITELESQLAQRFDAADMATAAAQGFRDGVAPVSAGPDDIDAIALTRYKVVHSHDSMFHRFAVVAGDGKQQLYLGRETECQNMTRKFAGAFLDGAFYQSQIAAAPTPAAQAADSVQEDAARYRWLREGNDAKHGAAWHIAVNLYGCEWDAAIDSARKQGANHDR